MRIVFWQDMLALLQSAAIRSLAERGHNVTVVVDRLMAPRRERMGWLVPRVEPARVIVPAHHYDIRKVLAESGKDAIHIIAGLRGYRNGRKAFRLCLKSKARVGFLSEGADGRGARGLVRRILYSTEAALFSNRVDFILAMGRNGSDWFRRCGYPEKNLVPYAYCVERPSHDIDQTAPDTETTVRLLYVGQCVPRKGLDLAISALEPLKHLDWTLTVIGDGPSNVQWRKQAQKTGLVTRIQFLPSMSNERALAESHKADLFILPSRFDGWGAVVNEMLMRGVPVVCSDGCGAADLLAEPWRGEVFRTGSVTHLTDILRKWINRGKRSPETTARIKSWAVRIQGDSVADYTIAALRYVYESAPRPLPPWC